MSHRFLTPTLDLSSGGSRRRTTGASFVNTDYSVLVASDNAALDFNTGDCVIVGWIKWNGRNGASGNLYLAGKYKDGTDFWRLVVNTSDKLVFEAEEGGATCWTVTGTTALVSGNTYTFAVVVDRNNASNCKIYLNGVDDTAGTPTKDDGANDQDNTAAFRVGHYSSTPAALNFHGVIAAIGIGKPADAGADISNILAAFVRYHNRGVGRYWDDISSGDKTTLAFTGFWDLSESTTPGGGAANNRADRVGTNHLVETFATMVTNGTFASGIAGWTNGVTYGWDVTCAWDGAGAMRLTNSGDGAPSQTMVYQQIAMTAGRTYNIAFDATLTAGNALVCCYGVADAPGQTVVGTIGASGSFAETHTPTTGNRYLQIKATNNVATNWLVDNVVITAANIPSSTN